MIYTKRDYEAGKLPTEDDVFYIFGKKFRIAHCDLDSRFLHCFDEDNDWAFKYLGIDKNSFFKDVVGEEYVEEVGNNGPCPYTDSVKHLMQVVNALWEYSPFREGDSVYVARDIKIGFYPEKYGYIVTGEMMRFVDNPHKIRRIENSEGDVLKYGFCKTYKFSDDSSDWYWTLGMFDVPKSLGYNASVKTEKKTIIDLETIPCDEKATTKLGAIALPKHTKHLKVTL